MSDLVSKQAVLDALEEQCNIVCQYSKEQRYVMCGACNLGAAFDAVEQMRPVDDDNRSLLEIMEELKRDTAEFYCDMEREIALLRTVEDNSCDNCRKKEECQHMTQYKGELPWDCPKYKGR